MAKSIKNTHKELKERWETVKKDLNEDSSIDNWNEVYDIFTDRIENRYFRPSESLRDHISSIDGFGFSMVTILCTLIEFLQSTIDGRFEKRSNEVEYRDKYTLLLETGRLKFYSNNGCNKFVWFLENLHSGFKDKPNSDSNHFNSVANEFYSSVRCALLHDACTRNNWIIKEKSIGGLIFDNSNREEKILY